MILCPSCSNIHKGEVIVVCDKVPRITLDVIVDFVVGKSETERTKKRRKT